MCGHTTITHHAPRSQSDRIPLFVYEVSVTRARGAGGGAGSVYLVFVIVSLSQPTVARGGGAGGRGGRYGGGMSPSGSPVVTMDSGYYHPSTYLGAARLRMLWITVHDFSAASK